jgi:hypothetical protein
VTDLLTAALGYVAHGKPVFPCRGKVPALPKREGGRGYLDATTDPDTIRQMWRRFPGANIGLRTGQASGWAVLDVDPDSGGLASLTDIEARLGVLPGTLMQISGRDGLHMVYRHRAGLGIGSKVWGPGLDLRGEGGYIVAAPSVHPETGHAYRWSGNGTFTHPVADWPAKQLPPPAERPEVPRGKAPAVTGGLLAGLVRTVLGAAKGERNTRLIWAAFRAGEHVARGRMDATEAVAALLSTALHVGLAEREAAATIEAGLSKGMKRSPA